MGGVHDGYHGIEDVQISTACKHLQAVFLMQNSQIILL